MLFGLALLLMLVGVIWMVFYGPGFSTLFKAPDTPTVSSRTVSLDLAGQKFFIPENYLRRSDNRGGGEAKQIEIHAVLPSLEGFSDDTLELFNDKTNDSSVIYITLTAPQRIMRPAERFHQIYPYYFTGEERQGEYGLKLRNMDENSGFSDFDILYQQVGNRFYLFHCLKPQNDLMPSDCLADMIVEPKILARYRFRRSALKNWQEVDASIETLLARFAGR